jgi:hypothetical protein
MTGRTPRMMHGLRASALSLIIVMTGKAASLYLGTTPTRCSTSRNRESERSGSHLGSTPSHDSQYECSS